MPGRWRGREAPMPGRFAETVGLDDSFAKFSFPGSRGPATPIVTLRQAVQLSSMPGQVRRNFGQLSA